MSDELSPEARDAIVQYFKLLALGLCPHCSAKIEEEQQVGRCVYAKPCGHRLYQGAAKAKKPKEHPFFAEQREWNKAHGEGKNIMRWKRYRFHTKVVEDYRPLVFNPAYPWWCSGEAGDGSFAVIVAYLPANEPLERYWPDAFDIGYTNEEAITFSDRFPKPAYFQREQS